MFLHFCEMLFLELVSGDFLFFWDSIPTCSLTSFIFLPATCFLGGKRDHLMFCYVEIVHRGS